MRNYIILFSLLFIMLQGCVNQPSAPIEYNHNKTFDHNAKGDSRRYSDKTIPVLHDHEAIISKPLNKPEIDSEKISGSLNEHDDGIKQEVILPEVRKDQTTIIYHDVQEQETLDIIAKNYAQNPEEIAALNNLTKPYHLDEFQTIKIKVNKEILNRQNTKNITNKSTFRTPVHGDIIVKFGQQTPNGKSNGINIIASEGNEIKSPTKGEVIFSGHNEKFGNLIIVKSNDDLSLAYAHMQDLILTKGSIVEENDIIGHVGHTGNVRSAQLHFAIRKGKTPVDPEKYIGN